MEKYGIMVMDLRPKKEDSTDDFLLYSYPKESKILSSTVKNEIISAREAIMDMYKKNCNKVIFQYSEGQKKEFISCGYCQISPNCLLILVTPSEEDSSLNYLTTSLVNDIGDILHLLIDDIGMKFF